MAYWGDQPADCDYAFGAVGVYTILIKERMLQDASRVIEKEHPEQSIVASVRCLRLLDADFKKSVRLHFSRRDLESTWAIFCQWFETVQDSLPPEHREGIWRAANDEFETYRAQLLHK